MYLLAALFGYLTFYGKSGLIWRKILCARVKLNILVACHSVLDCLPMTHFHSFAIKISFPPNNHSFWLTFSGSRWLY